MQTIVKLCVIKLVFGMLIFGMNLNFGNAAEKNDKTVYDFTVKDINGKNVSLSDYKGQVLLIVNVASFCGNTPQYKELENLYETYKDQGFEVLAFPCNQFGEQEPGTAKEIKTFCESNYHITFPLFAKIDVNGDKADPLYKYLKAETQEPAGEVPVKWNFAKFLIDKEGKVAARIEPKIKPATLANQIEGLLMK